MANPTISPEALALSFAQIRAAGDQVDDPIRKRLEQMQAREQVTNQGQSAINSAMRTGAKTGMVSRSGASQATSGALGRVADASQQAAQTVAIQQAKDSLDNKLKVANAAQGLGISTAQLAQEDKRFNEMVRQYNEQPERMRQQMELQLELKRRGLPYDKELLEFQTRLQNQLTGRDWLGAGSSILGGIIGAVGKVAAPVVAASDINLKENIEEATEEDIQHMLDNLDPYKYTYKNSIHGEGEQVSVMAQDLEKSKLGSTMVIETPEGKMVNYGKGFGIMLASQAYLNKQLKEIKQALGAI